MRNLIAIAALFFALTGYFAAGVAHAAFGSCNLSSSNASFSDPVGERERLLGDNGSDRSASNRLVSSNIEDTLRSGDQSSPYPPYFHPAQ